MRHYYCCYCCCGYCCCSWFCYCCCCCCCCCCYRCCCFCRRLFVVVVVVVVPVVCLESCVNVWLNLEDKKRVSDKGSKRQGVKMLGPTKFRDSMAITTYSEGPGFKPRPGSYLYLSESQVLWGKMYFPTGLHLLPFTCSSMSLTNHITICILYWQPLYINPLNAELNPIRHLLTLIRARHIVHVSRIRIKLIR